MSKEELLKYPGGEIVVKGLNDINKNKETIESLLLCSASVRLNELGFKIQSQVEEPYLVLYKKLAQLYGSEAHYKYNSLMQRLNKFLQHF
jgi:hypothetical protein